MGSAIDLIVGLGNPGSEYEGTRHNAGALFVARLAEANHAKLQNQPRHGGLTGAARLASRDVRLLLPTTYMNRSGQSVASLAGFYKIDPPRILVVHDELDLPPGSVRLKVSGGHGGHNGLRSIIAALGNRADFQRLRLGIGHPGSSADVSPYVLSKAPRVEREALDDAITASLEWLPALIEGDSARAMNHLHSLTATGR
jgi:PTH1 family peptidyl-tRNA hydrolase